MKRTLFILLIISILLNTIILTKRSDNIMLTFNDIESILKYMEDYKEENLYKYISYIDSNIDVPYIDAIYLINNDINYPYSINLSKIVRSKYFIKDNLDLYLNNIDDDINKTISIVNTFNYNKHYTNTKLSDLSKEELILVNKYNYLDNLYVPNDLEEIDENYNKGINNKLRKIAKDAFEKMAKNALLDNIYLYNLSAYRAYGTQEYIYSKNVLNDGESEADKTSARPGYSEHQTGLAIDLNWINIKFEETNEYKWLEKNAYLYGFILRYPKDKEYITGYTYEPWHYRYVGESIAKKIVEENITFDEYYSYYLR